MLDWDSGQIIPTLFIPSRVRIGSGTWRGSGWAFGDRWMLRRGKAASADAVSNLEVDLKDLVICPSRQAGAAANSSLVIRFFEQTVFFRLTQFHAWASSDMK
jgi:hypothetical protein